MSVKSEMAAERKVSRYISVDTSERVCVNCIWFEQYFRDNRGNVMGKVPVNRGYCILGDKPKRPLSTPCKHFETEENHRRDK